MPNLIEVQHNSYRFLEEGLKELFRDISQSGLHREFSPEFVDYSLGSQSIQLPSARSG